MAYAILRTQKLSLKKLPQAISHNQREVQPANADSMMKEHNVDYLATDKRTVMERWQGRMAECGNPKVRKNAVAGIELLMGFSPEAATWIDADEWGKDCVDFANRVFGCDNTISAVQHRDEKTIHTSTISIPIIKKSIRGGEPEARLSASEWLDGPVKLRELQTRFFEEVGRKHGLERGEEGSSRQHIPQQNLYLESNKADRVINDAVQSAPTIESHESKDEYLERIRTHLVQNLAALAAAAKQGALTREVNRAAARESNRRKEETDRRKRAEEDRDQAIRESARLQAEQQARLRDLSVAFVLEQIMGVRPRREGNQKVFTTPEIKIIVAQDDRRFSVYKSDKRGGSGAISAVMQAADLGFTDAVRWLAAHYSASEVESTVRSLYEPKIRQVINSGTTNPATFAEQVQRFAPTVETNWAVVRHYLIETRALPSGWIDSLHARNRVWANHSKSACFAHHSEAGSSMVGVSVRGTYGHFKQTLGNKNAGFFRLRLGQSPLRQIVVVESPIEAVSLAGLERDRSKLYASSAGAGGLAPILQYARNHALVVIAAQNIDAAGEVQAALTDDLAREHKLTCHRQRPPFADWNDTLRFLAHEMHCISRNAASNTNRLRAMWQQSIHVTQHQLKIIPTDYLLPLDSADLHKTDLSI